MRNFKKVAAVVIFVLPAALGVIGYMLAGNTLLDAAYQAVGMYILAADSCNNNALIELARWFAPVVTVSGLILILKTAFSRVADFFMGFSADAVAVYGDTDLKEAVKKNIKHAIGVDDGEAMAVDSHIIMFSTDEKGLEFYTKNKDKLHGDVFIKLDKNDSFSVKLDKVKFFNPCEIISRDFWQENDLRRLLKNDGMKIAIVGSDVLSRKILTFGLMNNIYTLTQKVEYHVWSKNKFFERVHCDFKTMNGDSVIFHDKNCEDDVFEIASADRIIITDKIENELLYEITRLTQGEIYCFDPMGTFVNVFDYDKIYPFGRYDEVLTAKNIREDNLYSLAKKLNHQYVLKFANADTALPTADEAWDELDVFTMGSNIASADYHNITLIIMRELGKTDVDDTMAELEHIRWCRYHYLNHWKYGETKNGKKDAINKIHPCLKPFDELDEANKRKDADGIRTLLSLEGV